MSSWLTDKMEDFVKTLKLTDSTTIMPDTREEASNEACGKNEKGTRLQWEICKSHPLVTLKGDLNASFTG